MKNKYLFVFCCVVSCSAYGECKTEEIITNSHQLFNAFTHLSQAEIRTCLEATAKNSTQMLLETEKTMQQAIVKWNAPGHLKQTATQQLSLSNEKFIKYRDNQCTFEAYFKKTGIGNMGFYNACVTAVNHTRILQLREWAAALPQK